MFYSHDILTRRGGKFYVLWYAAMKSAKLSRKEINDVDITKMCEDVVTYFPTRHSAMGTVRLKFSLYLSTQLMYGTVVIYAKQIDFLLESLRRARALLILPLAAHPGIDLPLHAKTPAIDAAGASTLNFLDADFGRTIFDANPVTTTKRKKGGANNVSDDDAFSIHTTSLLQSLVGSDVSDSMREALHIAHPSKITLQEEMGINGNFGFCDDFLTAEEQAVDQEFLQELEPIVTEIMEPPSQVGKGSRPVMDDTLLQPRAPEDFTRRGEFIDQSSALLAPPAAPSKGAGLEGRRDVTVGAALPPNILEIGDQAVDVAPRFELSPLVNGAIPPARQLKRRLSGRFKRLLVDEETKISNEELKSQLSQYGDTITDQAFEDTYLTRTSLKLKTKFWHVFHVAPEDQISSQFKEVWQDHTETPLVDIMEGTRVFDSPPWTIPRHLAQQLSGSESSLRLDELPIDQQGGPPDEGSVVNEKNSTLEFLREISSRSISDSKPAAATTTMDSMRAVVGEVAEETMADLVPFSEAEPESVVFKEPRAKKPRGDVEPEVDHLQKCFPLVPDMPGSKPKTFALESGELLEHIKEVSGGRMTSFDDLVPKGQNRAVAGKSFFHLLNLLKQGSVQVEQREPFGQILIKPKNKRRTS